LRALLFAGLISFSFASARAVTIPTVAVGDAGNLADSTGYGAVAYEYRIGATEVTNSQYVAFLNSKAASDPLGLYNTSMGSAGGIVRSGVSGSFTYAVKPNLGDKPVNFVSWYDSVRFTNWLNNGQGNGDTETGTYTLLGGSKTPNNGVAITRNSGATWFLPNENEWYKAAYYQPTSKGGDSDNYWLYPTASNDEPTIAHANDVGDISNPGANVANYETGAAWGSRQWLTTVGSAGPLSQSYYGTSDQGGNAMEWVESLILGSARVRRGGSYTDPPLSLSAPHRSGLDPGTEVYYYAGFRVATVPEPSTYALAAIGVGGLLAVRRRKSL
jgi:formylglycine-generating enzyme required for sulfatase activity